MTKFNLENRTNLPATTCVNCTQNYQGFFCPRCGQKSLEGRFTFKESIGWIFDKIFNLERGIFFTIKDLIFRPGLMLSSYLGRATVRYVHPFRFVFLMATISAIATILSGAFESEELMKGVKGYIEGFNDGNREKNLAFEDVLAFFETVKKYFAFLLILNIPIISIASYIVFKKFKKNFTEHLIINCYAYGLYLVLSLPFFILILLNNGIILNQIANTFLYFIIYVYIFSKLFCINFFKGMLRVLLAFIVSSVFTLIVLLILLISLSILFMN